MNENVVDYQITVSADASELLKDINSLSALVEATECVPEVIQGVIDLFGSPDEFIGIDSDLGPAGAADHIIVRFKPSDRFAVLMAALRADKFEGVVV